jgi:hypothetical protein
VNERETEIWQNHSDEQPSFSALYDNADVGYDDANFHDGYHGDGYDADEDDTGYDDVRFPRRTVMQVILLLVLLALLAAALVFVVLPTVDYWLNPTAPPLLPPASRV